MNAEITSANVVGYQFIEIPVGYSLYTVTFKNISGGEYNINDFVPYQNGEVYPTQNKVYACKIEQSGDYSSNNYNYRKAKNGWCKTMTLQTDVTIGNGEALCFNNTTDAPIMMRTSGEVELNPVSKALAPGYHLIGNMTPVSININDMVPYTLGGEIYPTQNKIYACKIEASGDYSADNLNYRKSKSGWCKTMTLQTGVTLAPGEAMCINNTSEETIELRFKGPIPDAE